MKATANLLLSSLGQRSLALVQDTRNACECRQNAKDLERASYEGFVFVAFVGWLGTILY